MKKEVRINGITVSDKHPCFIAAEIGINHNGDMKITKSLIDMAIDCGCDAVKFQKRTVDVVYSQEELARHRESPFGTTNGDLKRGLEFGLEEYQEIEQYCKEKGILWYASCWDEGSVDFIEQFDPPCYKISSASLTDLNLLRYTKSTGKPIILSTGMSTMEQVEKAVEVLSDDIILLHCVSTYPAENNELNLGLIPVLKERFDCPVGYSGHEKGVVPSVMAVVMGSCMVERHITLDRTMWGSDQAASLEKRGLDLMIRDIRLWPEIKGDGVKKILKNEVPIMEKLRRVA